MSLICCPECGHNEVSSYATSCPYCGYNIRAHIETTNRIAAEERMAVLSKKAEQDRIEQKISDTKDKLEKTIKSIENYEIPEEPEKPSFIKSLFWINGLSPLMWDIILCCVCFLLALLMNELKILLILFSLAIALLILFGIPISIAVSWNTYKEMQKAHDSWKTQTSDFDGYKRRRINEEKKNTQEILNNLSMYGTEHKPVISSTGKPSWMRCPCCGSENIVHRHSSRWYITECKDCRHEISRINEKPRL